MTPGVCPQGGPLHPKYKVRAPNHSSDNTPLCFSIYDMGLVPKSFENKAVQPLEKLSSIKAQMIYDIVDNPQGF